MKGSSKSPRNETHFAFTKTRLLRLSPPASGRAVYHDDRTPGLTLRITERDERSFYLYRKFNGRPVRYLLGRFPEMTVEQARKACQQASAKLSQGKDLQTERRAARHEQTVGGLFAFWLETHARPHKKSWAEDERQYNAYLKAWANRKLSAVKKADVQSLHARIGERNGRYTANRLLALLRAMFNKAVDMGFTGPNPTLGVRAFKETKRDRFIQGDELPRFFRALRDEANKTLRDFFMLCLLTGARRANVQAMRWTDLDLNAGLWRIPETKSGQPVIVPLIPQAVAILEARKESTKDSPWVFPGRRGESKHGHIIAPTRCWHRICKRAGIENVRIHDLRRSLGSWLAMTGSSLPIIGKLLGHSQPSTTAVYARLAVDPVRHAVETAAGRMFENGKAEIIEGKLLPAPEEDGAKDKPEAESPAA